eukprot:scaffold291180_cov27-Tisochrysis_lutea.AAC.1
MYVARSSGRRILKQKGRCGYADATYIDTPSLGTLSGAPASRPHIQRQRVVTQTFALALESRWLNPSAIPGRHFPSWLCAVRRKGVGGRRACTSWMESCAPCLAHWACVTAVVYEGVRFGPFACAGLAVAVAVRSVARSSDHTSDQGCEYWLGERGKVPRRNKHPWGKPTGW